MNEEPIKETVIPDGCPLHRKTPYLIQGVSMSQFSIARYYGGITFQGDHYDYLEDSDELIRDDVRKWLKKQKPC